MTSPGTGMESGDDYVAARMSIDIPSEGVQGIKELTENVDRFRTAMEAATRAEADMTSYLSQMGEATRKATEYQAGLVDQLSKLVSIQGHLTGGGGGNNLVPAGYSAPFQGAMGGLGNAPGQRIPNPTDVAWQLGQHAQNSPREYRNMTAARGAVDTTPAGSGINLSSTSIQGLAGAISSREHAARAQDHATGSGAQGQQASADGGKEHVAYPFDRVRAGTEAASGFAGQVLGELGGHQGLPFYSVAQSSLDSARNYRKRKEQSAGQQPGPNGEPAEGADDSSGDTASPTGIDKTLGGASAVLGGLGAIFGLVQSGGSMIQGMRNVASVRGGSGGEGLEAEWNARMLAMDPFITTDQARQMSQAGVSEGYLDAAGNPMGKNGGKAMDFYRNNIEKYNIDPAQSTEMLRGAAKGTTVSIDELSNSLATLKKVVAGGGPLSQSLPDIINEVTSKNEQLLAQGVNPSAAWQQSINSAIAFNGDPILQGTMSTMTPNAVGTAGQRMFGGPGGTPLNIPAGLSPDAIQEYINDKYPDQDPMYNDLSSKAQRFKQEYHDTNDQEKNPQGWYNARNRFYRYIVQTYPTSDLAKDKEKAYALYDKFAFQGATTASVIQENKDQLDKGSADQRQTKIGYEGGINVPGFGNIGGRETYSSTALDSIVSGLGGGEKGTSAIEVNTGDGWKPLDRSNKYQIGKLDSGQAKWRHKGDTGEGIDLEHTPGTINDTFSTDDPGNPKGLTAEPGSEGGDSAVASGKVTIDLTDAAKKILKVTGDNPIPLTANSDAANKGQGQAQVNNPPPGDAPLQWPWLNGRGR